MELLNNIWNAISTPNQGLINIIMLIGCLVEIILSFLLFSELLGINSTRKQKITYICISTIESFIFMRFIPSPFNSFANLIFIFFLVLILFKQTVVKSLIAVLCPMIIFALTGSLIQNPYLTIFKLTFEQANLIPIYRIGYLTIIYSIVLLIIFILKHKISYIRLIILDNINKKNKFIIFANLIFGILVLIIQAFISVYYIDILPMFITFFSFLSLLAYFAISIYSLTRVMKLTITTQKLESAEEYNKTLHILHDSVRGFKHDFDNIVTTIGGYVKTNDMDGLKKYYIQLEDDCQKVNNLYLLNPEIINNPRYI